MARHQFKKGNKWRFKGKITDNQMLFFKDFYNRGMPKQELLDVIEANGFTRRHAYRIYNKLVVDTQ